MSRLKIKKIEGIYWSNVKKIKESPCSFTIELMPYDKIASSIPDLCERCKKMHGAVCHATVGRDDATNGKKSFNKNE